MLLTVSVLLKCILKNPCRVGGWGEGIIREFGTDRYTLLYLKWITNKGTLLNVIWHPGWEGSLGQNEYMYMYGWIPLLYTWNYYNIIILVYSNTKKKFKEKIPVIYKTHWWGIPYQYPWDLLHQDLWVHILSLPRFLCVILDKSFNFLRQQFFHL